MKEGDKVFIIHKFQVCNCQLVKSSVPLRDGLSLRVKEIGTCRDFGAIGNYSDGTNALAETKNLFLSRIVAYSVLEERLISALLETRKVIREHRQKFNRTNRIEDFKRLNSNPPPTDEELDREIVVNDYHEVYHEDKLSDL